MTDTEINEAVARGLGWTEDGDGHWHQPWMSPGAWGGIPLDYCHDIKAVWEILTDHCDTWEIFCNGSTVDVTLSKSHNTAGHEANTAQMAICLAFLKLQNTNATGPSASSG